MSKILHIFDVSPFLHAGHINKASKLEKLISTGSSWKTQVTPTGGTSLLFNTLYEVMGTGDCVFCCDRNPTIKKDMIPGYKSNRTYDRGMEVEKGACEYILEQCGCNVIARAGYEADDIIYSIVKDKYKEYDIIYIYTGDSDLYFMVDDKVSIRPCSSRAKRVNMDNFKEVTGYEYNTITLCKILYGDSSDCIPSLDKKITEKMADTFFQKPLMPKLGSRENLEYLFSNLYPDYLYRVDWVYPLYVDDIPLEFKRPNKQLIVNFGDAINNRFFRNKAQADFDVRPYVDELQSRGLYIEED